MQLKIAKILNQILIVMAIIILLLIAGFVYVYIKHPDVKFYYLIGFVLISIAMTLVFKWFENSWDKKVITKMAQNKKIAIANIKNSERVMRMRDSSFVNYWLYEFDAIIIDQDQNQFEKKIYEKMSAETKDIPNGTVFITYDEEKPNQIFIIPTVMISRIRELIPIVAKYENNKENNIKYLNAYYNNGMVINTMKEYLEEQKKTKEAEVES